MNRFKAGGLLKMLVETFLAEVKEATEYLGGKMESRQILALAGVAGAWMANLEQSIKELDTRLKKLEKAAE